MANEITVDFRELAKMIVREHGITKGHWGIWVSFGIGGTNAGPDAQHLFPAAVVPITQIGIQRFDAPNNLTVDAAKLARGAKPNAAAKRSTPVKAAPKAKAKARK